MESSPPPPPPRAVQPLSYADVREQKHRLTMALVCLHIAALLLLGVTLAIPTLLMRGHAGTTEFVIFGAFGLGFAGVHWLIAWGITRRYYWAWICGIIVFAIYATSILFILGGFGLWGLLNEGSRAQFRQG
jgi:hypothetical protein